MKIQDMFMHELQYFLSLSFSFQNSYLALKNFHCFIPRNVDRARKCNFNIYLM